MSSTSSTKRSFYTLELFVQPGGSRMSWLFIVNNITTIKEVLTHYFEQDSIHLSLYHLLSYGTSIIVQHYENGNRIRTIDIVPLIQVSFAGFESFAAADLQPQPGDDGRSLYSFKEKNTGAIMQLEEAAFSEILFNSYDNDSQLTWEVEVDWDRADIRELTGTHVGRFDVVEVYEHYCKRTSLRYAGVHNTEFGGFSNEFDPEVPFQSDFEDQEYYEIELSTEPAFCEIYLKEVAATIDLTKYGFTLHTTETAVEYSDYDYVPIATREVGDEYVGLKYNFRKKRYELFLSLSIRMIADLNKSFFQYVQERYIDPALSVFPEYGQYDRSKMDEEIPRLRGDAAVRMPRQLDAAAARKIRYDLGNGPWEKMIELEQQLIKNGDVFGMPVALASSSNSIQKEITQFYTVFSASLVSIHARPAASGFDFSLECEYIPDPDNKRSTEADIRSVHEKMQNLPLDLFKCISYLNIP